MGHDFKWGVDSSMYDIRDVLPHGWHVRRFHGPETTNIF